MKKTIAGVGILGFALPAVAFAQSTLMNFITYVGDVLNILIPLIVTLAIAYFFWGLAKYILNAGDETKKAEGKNTMIWGVIALFVMVSVWGLVGWLQTTLGVNASGPSVVSIVIPTFY